MVNFKNRITHIIMNNAIIADLVVYGKNFTSEDNQIVEAFAVKKARRFALYRIL